MGTWVPFRWNLKGTLHLELFRARFLWLHHCSLASVESFQWHQKNIYRNGHVVDLTVFNLSFSSLNTRDLFPNLHIHTSLHFTSLHSSAWLYLYFSSSAFSELLQCSPTFQYPQWNVIWVCPGCAAALVGLWCICDQQMDVPEHSEPLRASALRATMAKLFKHKKFGSGFWSPKVL